VQLLQIFQIRLTVGATNYLEMEADVIQQPRIPCVEQITSQNIPIQTTDAMASPDRSYGMLAIIPPLHDLLQLLA
jgi:hypothetical protein